MRISGIEPYMSSFNVSEYNSYILINSEITSSCFALLKQRYIA